MDAAVNVRNICAHYNRLYNQPLEEQRFCPTACACMKVTASFRCC